jgi:DNA adenine methylase
MKTKRPPFKTHGGKRYLAKFIIDQFPENYENMFYLEPYVGGGSIFFNKKRSGEECLNDLHPGIVQIFRALRDEPQEFIRRLKKLEYAQETFDTHLKKTEFDDYLNHAVNEFVLRRMSRGGLKKHFSWSKRKRGGKPGDVNAWLTILEELPSLAPELKSVYIMNECALKVIDVFNDENTLLYADPPYLPETRVSQDAYEYDMTIEDHVKLADKLNSFKGKVILSGYNSKLYKRLFPTEKIVVDGKALKPRWRIERKMIVNHSSQIKSSKDYRIEMLWLNF